MWKTGGNRDGKDSKQVSEGVKHVVWKVWLEYTEKIREDEWLVQSGHIEEVGG